MDCSADCGVCPDADGGADANDADVGTDANDADVGADENDGGDADSDSEEELPAASRVIAVASSAELASAVENALPGDHIVLADGEYASRLNIDRQGTAEAPIVIRARNILKVHLPAGFELTPASRHIWIYGVDLKDASSILQGENHVLRRVRIWPPFRDGKGSTGIRPMYGKNARIDYCEIRLYTTSEVQELYGKVWEDNTSYGGVQQWYRSWEENWFDNLTIERCLLTGGPHDVPYASPNSQFIEACGNNQTGDEHDIHWTVRDVFGDVPRDRTLIDFKYRTLNLERVHIISRAGGAIQVRTAGNHSIKESRFEGAAVRINGDNNVIENTFASQIQVLAGDAAWDDYSEPGAHRQAIGTRLFNTSGNLTIGYQFSTGGPYDFPALDTLVEGHDGNINYRHHENSTVRPASSLPVKPPVTLDASVVGPSAPWVGVEP